MTMTMEAVPLRRDPVILQQVPTPVPGDMPVPPTPVPGQPSPAPVEDPGDDPTPVEEPVIDDPSSSPDAPPPMIA